MKRRSALPISVGKRKNTTGSGQTHLLVLPKVLIGTVIFFFWWESFKNSLFWRPVQSGSMLWIDHGKSVLRYRVCGDASLQLASHVSAIASAIRSRRPIEILDEFVIDNTSGSKIPLSSLFDTQGLVESIWMFGADAKIVNRDLSNQEEDLPCYEFLHLEPEDTEIPASILQALEPSDPIKEFVDQIMVNLQAAKGLDLSQGVCLHNPRGAEWKNFCKSWSATKDGLYHGNCDGENDKPLLKLLKSRSLADEKRWIYYARNDEIIPQELLNSNHDILSRNDIITNTMEKELLDNFPSVPDGSAQNLWSLIEALICRSLPHFVGNSVHTWSAMQIALHELDNKRDGSTYWYNSQSIPLADSIPVYHIPVVYTYTELSAGAGKYLLKASITSVKQHMPRNRVHILYHGDEDVEFRSWLEERGAILHQHEPDWRPSIEEMRQKGDPMRSHLFLHEGNYFGTWQRIDIPKFIDFEYCLLMDSDTIVVKPFTMTDFGRITKGMAFSAEADQYLIVPLNAGISLMNVPFLRETHTEFIDFIMQHVDGSPYNPDAPSDQGAYLDFYKGHVDFLSIEFNFKPYYVSQAKPHFFQVEPDEAASARILHFHGPKPHHYIGHFLGLPCDAAAQFLCDRAAKSPALCTTVTSFARNLLFSGEQSTDDYCRAVYRGSDDTAELCSFLLERLGKTEDQCKSLPQELSDAKHAFHRLHAKPPERYVDPNVDEFKYNVCNGLSNQLVYHTIGIVKAIKQKRPVSLVDSFIFNGVQPSDVNVLPTSGNSVPLRDIFDMDHLVEKIADYGIVANLVPPDWDLPANKRVPCIGMTPLSSDDAEAAMDIISAFRPVGVLKDAIAAAKQTMKEIGLDISKGVCVHHRDGKDWHDHCGRWGSISDGLYRGNCLNETEVPFLESLESRALHDDSNWIYYVGDHEPPKELSGSKYAVVTKDDFLSEESKSTLMNGLFPRGKPVGPTRDLWALIDFVLCDTLDSFVGNSVSSWSAVQLAVRQKSRKSTSSGTYWYNSQSIPLADFLPVFQIPVVFVYTELSSPGTKYLLRASISSVKRHMNGIRINVLYHGHDDNELRAWLRREGAVVHQHYPKWRPEPSSTEVQGLRQKVTSSFVQWQRIDVPLRIESEYCLVLEPGTIVQRHFTLADFGLDLTRSVAFEPTSTESSPGLSLLNIPRLRKTHAAFLAHVHQNLDTTASDPQRGVQRTYSDFYNKTIRTLPRNFAFRPYDNIPRRKAAVSKVIQFHTIQPHQYLGHVLGLEYDETTNASCQRGLKSVLLCPSLQSFGKFLLLSGERVLSNYCRESFSSNKRHQDICVRLFRLLVSNDDRCDDLAMLLREVNLKILSSKQTARRTPSISLLSEDFIFVARYSNARVLTICGIFGVGIFAYISPRVTCRARASWQARMSLWTTMRYVLLAVILGHVLVNLLVRY